jgi:hypothetical protein
MATISKTSAEIRAHRSDAVKMARLRARPDADTTPDPDEATGEPAFTIRAVIRRRILSGAYQDGDMRSEIRRWRRLRGEIPGNPTADRCPYVIHVVGDSGRNRHRLRQLIRSAHRIPCLNIRQRLAPRDGLT